MRFLHSFFRRLQFYLGPDPVEKDPHAFAHGDVAAVPNAFSGLLTAPFVNSRDDCGGGAQRVPAAIVDNLLHDRLVTGKASQDHV